MEILYLKKENNPILLRSCKRKSVTKQNKKKFKNITRITGGMTYWLNYILQTLTVNASNTGGKNSSTPIS